MKNTIATLSKATFTTNDVALYLNRNFPYAATCFAQDMLVFGDVVPALQVEKWFKNYFPRTASHQQYRLLEATVTQLIPLT